MTLDHRIAPALRGVSSPFMISQLAACTLLASFALAGAAAQESAPPGAAETPPAEPPAMREISPGIYQIGSLRLDQKQRTVSFPGKLNMADGQLEYLLVTPAGATHEALLVTETQPADLHFAMLLLGAHGAGLGAPAPEDAPPAQINKDYLQRAPKLKGDELLISVKWKAGDAENTVAVEDWLMNPKTRRAAPRGPWLYTGSMFKEGKFLAQVEGTFAALVTYPAALINNPREHNDDDSAWEVNAKAVPPVDTPVEIVLKLANPPKPAEPK